MADVWLGRFSRWIEKLFNAKGGPIVVDVASDVQPVISLDKGNDQRYLEGWFRYGVSTSITGGAGANAGIELHNPGGSNVVAVVERLGVTSATLSNYVVSLTPGPNAIADFGVVQALKMDGRQNTNSSLIFSTSTAAVGFANSIMQAALLANTNYQFINKVDDEIVLMPASAMILITTTNATNCTFEISWRERALEQSELT